MKPRVPILALTGVLLLVVIVLAGSAVPMARAQTGAGLIEPFDDASQFVTSTPFFSDGGGDYFGLTDGATGDFGGGPMPSALKPYSGFTGNFMTGMDMNGEGAALPISVDWTGIDITGLSSLEFSGDFAEYFDDPGDIDEADYIRILVQIDGGGYQNLLWFSGADFTSGSGPYNGIFREDTDFDGVGDGAVLGDAALNFVKAISGSGTTLDLRMLLFLDSGDEDFGADNFMVGQGGPQVCPGAIPIADVQGSGASSPLVGQEVIIHGLVTADFGSEIVVQENSSAARSAVLVYASGNDAARGDEVCVTGIAAENYDMTQVGGGGNPSAAVDILSGGNSLPAPADVNTGDIATGSATAEDWESVLVKVQTVTVASPDLGFGEWSVDDTSGAVRVDDKGSYTYSPVAGEALAFVQGPLFYTFSDFKMEPRDDDDIGLPSQCEGAIPIADVQGPGDASPLVGQEVIIHGLVTADFGSEIVVQENSSAARSAVLVYASGNDADRGDDVCVTGIVAENYDMTQVGGSGNPSAAVDIISGGNSLPAPAVVSTGDIATGSASAEDWESVLVKVKTVTVASPDLGFGEWSVDDTSGAVRVDDKGSYTYSPTLNEALDFVQGPLFYTFSDFKMEPRDDDDIALAGAGTPQPVISEIMYNPASSEDDWEWIEVYNEGTGPINLTGWVVDDINGTAHAAANIAGGTIPAGEIGILFNADDVSAADFTAAWGNDINLIPVANWGAMALNNSGDQIGLWDSFASYSGDHSTHNNVIEGVTYTDDPPWPADDGSASINLTDLAADNNNGANWALSAVGAVTPTFTGYQSAAAGGNSGSDVGSPGPTAPVILVCGDPATFIHEVQGPGGVSPIVGQGVTIEGVVVGDFQESGELNGFFVQEEDADFDGDVNTSEGVFVFEGGYVGPDVSEGDLVRVAGTVDEYYTHTEVEASTILLCESVPGPYGPVPISLPEVTDGDLEKVEGMNVDVTNTMSVAQNYFLGRYGQLTLSSDLSNRLYQPTNQVLPNSPESAALADYNNRHLLFLDDGVDVNPCGDNPVPVPYLGAAPPAILRGGDLVEGLVGVLDYGQINSGTSCGNAATLGRDYRLQPTQAPVFSNENARTAAPADVGGSVKMVSFNVLNFFNGDGQGGGFPTSRGADTFSEFVRQRIKIYEAMKAIDGDIVGLMEIENDGFDPDSAIAELVKVLNEGPCWNSAAECAALGYTDSGLGAGTYAYINAGPGFVGSDAIAVGYIYKPASVTPVGDPLVVDDPAFTDPNNTGSPRNRPAIAQTFVENSSGAIFTPIVNHLKSKGSSCGAGDDDPEQASCNVTRTLAAQYLVDTVVPAVQAASGDSDVAIIGDLNAYAMEDPIRALVDGGFTNLIKAFNGDHAYSYTFDGLVGYLDHSLANDSLTAQVTGVTEWHINTDEPSVIDYNEDFNPPGYFSPDPYRASDHDPVVVGLELSGPPAVDINDLLDQVEVQTSYNPTAAPSAPAGIYTITATFSNISSEMIRSLFFEVAVLSGRNLLLNADGGPAGVGATLTVDPSSLGGDGQLAPGEQFTVDFEIGLQKRRGFNFYVDAYGVPGGAAPSLLSVNGDDATGFEYEVPGDELIGTALYLPMIR